MANDLLEQDIQAIIKAGGTDSDVENYLKESGVSYSIGETKSGEIMSPRSYREQKAVSRGGSFDWMGAIKKGTEENPKDFLGNVGRGLQIPLAGMTGAYNVGESALSDIAL
jgi:hypothetical protein